ncbi:MAG: ligand-binding sensor domain-containing protein, partial [Paraclostridium sp.]
MIKKIILTLITLIFVIKIDTINAQESISFKNITINDGLSQGTVQALLQDKQGQIWIGTNDGLNLYNGHEIKVYKYKENSKHSISNSYILNLDEDKEGNIWVATIGGVSKINPYTEEITNYYQDIKNGNLSDNNVYDILITTEGNILIATANGIDIYDKKEDKFTPFIKNKSLLTHPHIYEIEQDNKGNIWAGSKKGLNEINIKTIEIKQYLTKENGHEDATIYKIRFYKNYLWIGTMDKGLYKINLDNLKIDRYLINENNKHESITVRDIVIDQKEDIWISTNIGFGKYDKEKDDFIIYQKNMYDINSLCDNLTFDIMEDNDGLLWIGTYAGISIFDSSNNIKHYRNDPINTNSIPENMVSGIHKDEQGLVWIGTNSKGVSILNRENDKTYQIDKSNGLSSNKVYDIKGKDNKIYISTDQGINIINKENKSIKIYKKHNGLNHDNVRTLLIDGNYLWAGTMEGACIINLETDEVTDLKYIWDRLGIKDKLNGHIFKDSKENYWIGNFLDSGLIKIDSKTGKIKHYISDKNNKNSLSNNAVRTINEDKEGNIWIGTSYGLNKLDPETETFTRYTTEDGISNNTIYGIIIDKNQNIWCSTNFGISRFDKKENKFLNFGIIDGLQGVEFNGKSYHISQDGEIFFGGTNGLNAFYPKDLNKVIIKKPLVIKDIYTNEKRYNDINNKEFKHNENSITAEMFLPYYKNEKDTKYYYKIEGINEKYKEIGSNKLNLANLSPGKYNIKLKAINGGGVVSTEESLNFTIKPVFWQSIEAIVLYIFIGLLLVIYYKNKVQILDSMVEKRTKEVSGKIIENEKLFDKVLQLERKKNSYFVNLSHELRTPLNVISSTEQLITSFNNKKGISQDSLNHHMNIIKRNTERLLELITNLMDIEKIEYGKYPIKKEAHEIVQVIEDEALRLKNHVEHKGIELIIDPEVEEKIVNFDKKEIKRCI